VFDTHIIKQLGYYVYRLIDPRNGETFYVGKGKGNRVFQHALDALGQDEDMPSLKLQRIRRILLDGHSVQSLIHRHGLDEETAFHVEAALIDAYPGLANDQNGHGNGFYGVRSADQVIRQYSLEEAELRNYSYLIINITHCFENAVFNSPYECARFAWKLNPDRARRVDYVIAVSSGIIVGVFKPVEWLPATSENFPTRGDAEGRWGFIGTDAVDEIAAAIMHKRIPNSLRKKGAANPIQYIENGEYRK